MTVDVATPKPPRRRRRIGRWVLLGVLVLAAAVALAPALASTAWMKPVLHSWLNTSPERRIEFGDVDLSWTAGVKLRDLRVWSEGDAEPMLEARVVAIDVELMPLLEKRIVAEEFTIEDAVARVGTRKGGRDEPEAPESGGGGIEIPTASVPIHLDDVRFVFPNGEVVVDEARMHVRVEGGMALLEGIEAHVNGGDVRGSARIGIDDAHTHHELDLVAEGMDVDKDLAPLLARAMPLLAGENVEGRTSGEAGLELRIQADGREPDAIRQSLRGGGNLALADVEIEATNWLTQLLRYAGRGEGEFRMKGADVIFDIRDGRVTTQEFPIEATGLDLRMRGDVTLEGELDYVVRVKPQGFGEAVDAAFERYAGLLDPGGYLPIRLTGPVTGPDIAGPDIASAVGGALQERATDLITDALTRGVQGGDDDEPAPGGDETDRPRRDPDRPRRRTPPGDGTIETPPPAQGTVTPTPEPEPEPAPTPPPEKRRKKR